MRQVIPRLIIARLVPFLSLLLLLSVPLRAAPADDLLRALRAGDMIDIMRIEGLEYGRDMAQDMFGGAVNAQWNDLISDIYDTAKMNALLQREFSESLGDTDAAPLIDYFTSPAGRYVVSLELAARRAMVDDALEETARDAYKTALEEELPRLEQIEAFVDANDLVEANVAGALNASLHFYRGLVDGGAFEMPEDDILREVWSQEAETRTDTTEWLYGFLLMAYEPMEDDALDAYIALSGTAEGRALNRALFAGFNRMYDEISYALGLAAAQQMQVQEL